jgi:tripartite-type tricarboxylate transporter receptor subunit TctC
MDWWRVRPPTGHTLMVGTIGIHAAYASYRKLAYKPADELRPVTILAEAANVVLVPALALQDLRRASWPMPRPTRASSSYGSAGPGSSIHMVTALFELMSGARMTHVPYKGSGPALIDLIGGQIQVMFENIGSGMVHIKSGKLRPLAVTGAQREPTLPEVPTVAEAGVPGYAATSWWTVAAPRGTPDAAGREDPAGRPKRVTPRRGAGEVRGPERRAAVINTRATPRPTSPARR